MRFDIGGGGTNVAVAFSRFGLKTGCICGIGRDANGKRILDSLENEKVSFLGKVGKGKSGYSMIIDSKKHNRTILTYKGESNEVSIKDVKRFEAKWLYYSSLLGKSFEAQEKLAEIFVANGGKLAFNPSSYAITSQDIRKLLRLSYVLILNKEEAVALCKRYGDVGVSGCRGVGMLKKLSELVHTVVVVTDKDKVVRCYD